MPSFSKWPGIFAMPGRKAPLRRRIRPVPKPYNLKSQGFTRESTGAILASGTVKLFRKSDDALLATGVSGSDGWYVFDNLDRTQTYYVTAYKAGSPVLAGIAVDLTV